MTSDPMASRLQSLSKLVPELETELKSFQSSNRKFQILKTVYPSNSTPQDPIKSSPQESPETLFILDSSFNPPSIAHRTLAQSALAKTSADNHPQPHRLLLLFAVMNADKAPSPASFQQRLAMMMILAQDLQDSIQRQNSSYAIPIDIALTKSPYYTDKSASISSEGSQHYYPSAPTHIHLIGFDTLTRFFAAKYYPNSTPPLSALNPYFDPGHRLRVTLRPDDEYGSVEEQRAFLQRIADGEMEREGGKREWAEQVELVQPNEEMGVSSTKIRKAAKGGDWETVRELCTPGVAEWVKKEELYSEDERGAKMA